MINRPPSFCVSAEKTGLELFVSMLVVPGNVLSCSFMNILIEDAETLEFLAGNGQWTKNVAEGKSYLTIAIGCTGGRHRSVVMADALGKFLETNGYKVRIHHRDIDR